MEQRSEAWHLARCGRFTGSRFADLMARTRTGPAASRRALLASLAVERLTGRPVDAYTNPAMQRGTDLEGEARAAYAFLRDVAVVEEAFIVHPVHDFVGVSPDGLVGEDGMVELKCPANMAKHLDALRDGAHATEYRWQLQGQLWVCRRKWVDAVSYDPRYPEELRLAIKRVERDEAAIKELESAVIEAEAEVAAMVAELNQLKEAA